MKILVLAPQPFFEERGAAIAVNHLVRALGELGHTVDLLAFNGGRDISHPGMKIHRARGFASMLSRAALLAATNRHDVIYAVSSAICIARILNTMTGIPYLYFMDSSIPDRIVKRHAKLRCCRSVFCNCVRSAVRGSLAVLPSCPALARIARFDYEPQRIIELFDIAPPDSAGISAPVRLREQTQTRGLIFMYAGNLEPHQGVEMLIEGFCLHHKRRRDDALVIVGGPEEIAARYRARAIELGCDDAIHFLGPRPLVMQRTLLSEADVLVSPRPRGISTPTKLFAYLDSGRPVLATRLYTHTQIVSDLHCVLCDPTPEQISEGMRRLATSPELGRRVAAAAKQLVAERHTYPVFRATVESIQKLVAEATEKAVQ